MIKIKKGQLKKLTKAQEKKIPVFIDRYIKLAEKPTDRKKATKAVQNLYKFAGFEKPIVIFGASPFQTVIMVAMSKILFKGKLIKDSSQLRSQLRSQLDSQLGSQLDSQLGSQLRSQLRSQLDSQLRSINNDWWLTVWWLVWAGWYMFGKYIGVKFDNEVLKLFIDFVTNVTFIIPYKGIAFVSETPKSISWKDKVLHNETKGAVEYADGYSLYSINGVRVTKKIVKTPEKLTKNDWLKESNLEVRRIIQERMGERFVKALKAKTIQKDKYGELLEVDLENDPEKVARYVKVKDASTPRIYFLRCPPDIETAKAGVSWSFGIKESEYNPTIET